LVAGRTPRFPLPVRKIKNRARYSPTSGVLFWPSFIRLRYNQAHVRFSAPAFGPFSLISWNVNSVRRRMDQLEQIIRQWGPDIIVPPLTLKTGVVLEKQTDNCIDHLFRNMAADTIIYSKHWRQMAAHPPYNFKRGPIGHLRPRRF